jgi:hypothetical protein
MITCKNTAICSRIGEKKPMNEAAKTDIDGDNTEHCQKSSVMDVNDDIVADDTKTRVKDPIPSVTASLLS